jgi:hypothetical protein
MSDLRQVRFQFAGPTIPAAHWVTALEEIPGRPVFAARFPSFDRRFTTQTRPWRFRSRMAGVLCKLPFTEVVEKNRIRCQRSLQDFYLRRVQDCSRPTAFKNTTVRERP